MATSIAPRHATNIVEKTIRWADALEDANALRVPFALTLLERTGGPVGHVLAEAGWDALADMVAEHTGKAETAPVSTRQAITGICSARADSH